MIGREFDSLRRLDGRRSSAVRAIRRNRKVINIYLPKSRAILDFFHLCVGNNGQCIFTKTFGKHIWEELKEFMIPAAKAETREKFLVSVIGLV